MVNKKIVVISLAVFTFIAFVYNNTSYAQNVDKASSFNIGLDSKIPESKLPAGAVKPSKVVYDEEKRTTYEKPLTQSEKDQRFMMMTGKSPEQLKSDMKAHYGSSVERALHKNVIIGGTTGEHTGRRVVGKDGQLYYEEKRAADAVTGAEYLAGKVPASLSSVKVLQPVNKLTTSTSTTTATTIIGTNTGGTMVTTNTGQGTATTTGGVTLTGSNTGSTSATTAPAGSTTTTTIKGAPVINTNMPAVNTTAPAIGK